MDENKEPSSETPAPGEPAPQADQPTAPVATRPRFRDRLFGMRAVAAVALAGLLLGCAGGAAIAAVSSGDDDHGHDGRQGINDHRFAGGPGDNRQMLPPNGNPIPPTTVPEGDES